jgi:maltose/moltooligosaccharide transporter
MQNTLKEMNYTTSKKPNLNIFHILNMNFGFLGLQFSFALQQTNMSPIYRYLGADENNAILWLAGPITGLIIQPIIGVWSDNTWSKNFGRRKPFFLVGAIIASIALFLMPQSSALWMAVSLLWILDAANNITMEPYRAFVADKLPQEQHSLGFVTQSFFTGLGSTLANFTPAILITLGVVGINDVAKNGIPITVFWAFFIGAGVTIASILYSMFTTKEIPPNKEELAELKAKKSGKSGIQLFIEEISTAFKEMPTVMKQLIPVKFFTWFAMFCYWQSITDGLALSLFATKDVQSEMYKQAGVLTGQVNGTYNIICFLSAFLLVPLAKKLGASVTHFISLTLAGLAIFFMNTYSLNTILFSIPNIFGEGSIAVSQVYLISFGLGIGWASMLSMPYSLLSAAIPANRIGVYMGIFNMFIVIPMLIQTLTMDYVMEHFLGNNKILELKLAGIFLIIGGICTLFIKSRKTTQIG